MAKAALRFEISEALPELTPVARRYPTRSAQAKRAAASFLAPAALLLTVLIALPLVSVVWRSFEYASLTDPSVHGFAGLDNYATVFDDVNFLAALNNTFLWTGVSVAGEYALGLITALALAQPNRFRAVFRGLIIVPWAIPIAVAGINWTWMLTPDYGVINLWLVKVGLLEQPRAWLGEMDTALLTVTFVNIWRSFPFYTLSMLAALQSIPNDLYEAAALDGANPFQRFWLITMPHLKTVSLTLILIHVIWTAINFDFIWVMTTGGPLNASLTLPIMIYRYAMQDFDIGAACALASLSMGFMATVFFMYYYGALRRNKEA